MRSNDSGSAAPLIANVADTALWMASVRGNEGSRADAVFHDPLASMLAGERGRRIAGAFSRPGMVAWGLVARTSAIDRLIHESLTAGVDTVINLGAGLDTRPYRMSLPSHIRWIEVDAPAIVDAKTAGLRGYEPVCRLERIGMDLLDRPSRNDLFARCAAAPNSTLVITEGVISYLSNDDAAQLSSDLFASAAIRFWIQDFDNAGKRRLPRGWEKNLQAAPFLFEVEDWFDFFKKSGWRTRKIITNVEQSRHIKRPYPIDFPFGLILRALPAQMREKILGLSGAVLWEKGES